MPELPEVEITRRNLERWLVGATVSAVLAPDERVMRSARDLAMALVGEKVRAVGRRGKWLRIELGGGSLVFSHLGMSGKWVRRATTDAPLRWERARIDVVRGRQESSVRYVDPRRFGQLVVSSGDTPEWQALGPDPLLDGIDVGRLQRELGRRRRAVKDALLDQSMLAGVGNIYATEALWLARIDPRSRSNALTAPDARSIARALAKSMRRALALDDGPEVHYVQEGAPNRFTVYGREGQACPRCRRPFVRIVLGGRGTTFCRRCQIRRR